MVDIYILRVELFNLPLLAIFQHPRRQKSKKLRTGTIVTQHAPASYCIQLEDGRLWRHHIDDPLKGPLPNHTSAPPVPTAVKASLVVQEPSIPAVSSDSSESYPKSLPLQNH